MPKAVSLEAAKKETCPVFGEDTLLGLVYPCMLYIYVHDLSVSPRHAPVRNHGRRRNLCIFDAVVRVP